MISVKKYWLFVTFSSINQSIKHIDRSHLTNQTPQLPPEPDFISWFFFFAWTMWRQNNWVSTCRVKRWMTDFCLDWWPDQKKKKKKEKKLKEKQCLWKGGKPWISRWRCKFALTQIRSIKKSYWEMRITNSTYSSSEVGQWMKEFLNIACHLTDFLSCKKVLEFQGQCWLLCHLVFIYLFLTF